MLKFTAEMNENFADFVNNLNRSAAYTPHYTLREFQDIDGKLIKEKLLKRVKS